MFPFLAKFSKKEKIGLSIAVAFIFLAFLDRVVIDPIKNKVQQVNREIEIAERELERDLRNLNQKEVITEEIGNCPVCTHTTEKVDWYESDFCGDGNATKTGNCVLCGARIFKVFKFTGIDLVK